MTGTSVGRTGLVLSLLALLAACSDPAPPSDGRPSSTVGASTPAASPPPAQPSKASPALRGRVAIPGGATLSVDASVDDGQAALSFELRNGDVVEVLRSEMRTEGGATSSYCEVKSGAGQGWIPESLLTDVGWDTGERQAASQEAPRVVAREQIQIDVQREEVESSPTEPPSAPPPSVPDVVSVAPAGSGKPFDSSALIVKGQYTIIDFFSERCGPCRRLAPQLEALATSHPRIVLRKVDVDRPGAKGIDWGSPIVQQYGISSLPYVELYDTDGTLVGTGQVAFARLDEISRQP